MTNLTFNSKIAELVLTTEEHVILKTLFNKVKDAEMKAQISKEEEECNCVECLMDKSLEELHQTINSTSEEVTPELISYFLKTILKRNGVNAEVIGINKVNKDSAAWGTQETKQEQKQEEEEEKLSVKDLHEFVEALSSPMGFLGLLSALSKTVK